MTKIIKMAMLVAIATTLAAGTVSCSKKDKNQNPNYYSYGDKKFTEIAWAGYYKDTDGYELVLSLTVPANVANVNAELNMLEVEIPNELMGQKIDLTVAHSGYGWFPYGLLKYEGEQYEWLDNNGIDLSGTNNWMKVTKNAGNNFTIEINLTSLGGKPLKCYYKGNFREQSGWIVNF